MPNPSKLFKNCRIESHFLHIESSSATNSPQLAYIRNKKFYADYVARKAIRLICTAGARFYYYIPELTQFYSIYDINHAICMCTHMHIRHKTHKSGVCLACVYNGSSVGGGPPRMTQFHILRKVLYHFILQYCCLVFVFKEIRFIIIHK